MSYPALTQLSQGYLHQDFWEDYGDPMKAVDDFLTRSDYSGQVADEIRRALAEFPTEQATKRFVHGVLECMYLPDEDGLTYRGWLQAVAERAAQRSA